MTPPLTVASSNDPQAAQLARQKLEKLVRERLAGRPMDGVGFVDELLAIVSQVGEVSCSPVADRGLRFELAGGEAVEVNLDRSRGKLRMLCARLSVLCKETDPRQQSNPEPALLYGGEGTIRQSWKARWSNTPGKHEFSISVVR